MAELLEINAASDADRSRADDNTMSAVFDALARSFQNVFWVDLAAGTAKVLKLDGYVTKGLDRDDRRYFSYESILGRYIADRVHPDDRASFRAALCLDSLREAFWARHTPALRKLRCHSCGITTSYNTLQ